MTDRVDDGLPDGAARRRAVTDFSTNLVVLAGAGTGKTALLVERVLNALGEGVVKLDGLAAITFTEKAAAEMRQRIAAGLEQLRAMANGESEAGAASSAGRSFRYLHDELGIPSGALASRALAALEQLDRARILTMHGFCAELLRAHPIEAGVDPEFAIDTGEQAKAASGQAWERYLATELGAGGERHALWGKLLKSVSLREVGRVARELAEFSVPERLLQPPYRMPSTRELLGAEARSLTEQIDAFRTRATGLPPTAEAFFGAVRTALAAFADRGLSEFQRLVATSSRLTLWLARSYRPDGGKRLAGVSHDEMRRLHRACRRLAQRLAHTDEELPPLLVAAAAPFALRFRDAFLEQGWVSFDGLLALTRDLLRDHLDVRAALQRRFRMLLVDEFQDTDPLQYEIVLLLAAREREEGRDAHAVALEPGKLFIVGDPKQSIYRFRGADYGAFQRACARVRAQGGVELRLSANFRSVAGITGPINGLFEDGRSTSWFESAHQPAYAPIAAVREARDREARVEVWTVDVPRRMRADLRRQAEGRLIAEQIERLVASGACRYGQISVLFRAFSSIPLYLRPLRERAIPFLVDGGKEFLKRPEVSQYLAILRALAQPADPTALLAFLRSPAGGLSDTELADYATGDGRWDWRGEPEPERFPRIAERFRVLRRLRAETRGLAPDAVVHKVMQDAQLLPLAAAAFEGAQRVANLSKLAETAGELARDGRLSLAEIVDLVQEGGLAKLESDSPLSDEHDEAVRITSVHKMKGLENEWVFLPDLAREDLHAFELGAPPVEVARLPGNEEALALCVRTNDPKQLLSPARAWFDLERERHEDAEELRVLYVALTRARERLVVIGAPPGRGVGRWLGALRAWGYDVANPPADSAHLLDGAVLHRLMAPANVARERSAVPAKRALAAVAAYDAAAAALRRSSGRPFASPSGLHEQRPELADETATRGRRSRDLGKAAGLAIHSALEAWNGEPAVLLDSADRIARHVAVQEDVDAPTLARTVAEILTGFLESPLLAVFRNADRIAREVPLLFRDPAGQRYRGSVDLIYRDATGALVVADYKTDEERDPALLEQRYGGQLALYARAVAEALGLPARPRAEIWLLRSGLRVTFDTPPPQQLSLWSGSSLD